MNLSDILEKKEQVNTDLGAEQPETQQNNNPLPDHGSSGPHKGGSEGTFYGQCS
jgi:hypothetical protein